MVLAAVEAMAQPHPVRPPRGDEPHIAAEAAASDSFHAAPPSNLVVRRTIAAGRVAATGRGRMAGLAGARMGRAYGL
ncbi:hypothetical protein ppKF707_4818 [Metapseudomonas furukawaii]|uniref:Uncharacterized protein n=1 Tax=Metapseudomonas furukawaii TaxID=1149133 RepID=A0AAD1C184_METFU|nr:hypothetical protein ppKF707_4818 [Pseudomonas furukawaii]BAU74706.1 hypothetical protein KF707C_30180 [Pseudomonas furukawaii]